MAPLAQERASHAGLCHVFVVKTRSVSLFVSVVAKDLLLSLKNYQWQSFHVHSWDILFLQHDAILGEGEKGGEGRKLAFPHLSNPTFTTGHRHFIKWWHCLAWPLTLLTAPNNTFCVVFHIFLGNERINFKFGLQVDHCKSQPMVVPNRSIVTLSPLHSARQQPCCRHLPTCSPPALRCLPLARILLLLVRLTTGPDVSNSRSRQLEGLTLNVASQRRSVIQNTGWWVTNIRNSSLQSSQSTMQPHPNWIPTSISTPSCQWQLQRHEPWADSSRRRSPETSEHFCWRLLIASGQGHLHTSSSASRMRQAAKLTTFYSLLGNLGVQRRSPARESGSLMRE